MNQQTSLQDMTPVQKLELAKQLQRENKELLLAQRQERRNKLAGRSGEVTTSLKIDADTLERLKTACKSQGTSVSQAFREFAKAYIKKHTKQIPQQQLDLDKQ